MSFLNEAQLRDLTAYVQANTHRYQPLQEELLDHLACMVEDKMARGLDYASAKKEALEYLHKDEVKKTEAEILYFIHTKPVLMKVVSFLIISCLISVTAWLSAGREVKIPEKADAPPSVVLIAETEPPDIAPLDGQRDITAVYGLRIHPVLKKKMLHRGVDFKAPMGTPILATADGTITFAAVEKNYGLKVVIQHDDHYKSLYAHLSEVKVKSGDYVKRGTVIGLVGNSGISTAPHLHYEILKDGKAVNPADYLPKT